jgi:hypothetical protein
LEQREEEREKGKERREEEQGRERERERWDRRVVTNEPGEYRDEPVDSERLVRG